MILKILLSVAFKTGCLLRYLVVGFMAIWLVWMVWACYLVVGYMARWLIWMVWACYLGVGCVARWLAVWLDGWLRG